MGTRRPWWVGASLAALACGVDEPALALVDSSSSSSLEPTESSSAPDSDPRRDAEEDATSAALRDDDGSGGAGGGGTTRRFVDATSEAGLADIVQIADIRMIERRDRAGFALEPLSPVAVARELPRENLDRDHAIETHVPCLVDLAHAPGTEELEYVIWTEARAGGQPHVASPD